MIAKNVSRSFQRDAAQAILFFVHCEEGPERRRFYCAADEGFPTKQSLFLPEDPFKLGEPGLSNDNCWR